jgi:hypothetical protein
MKGNYMASKEGLIPVLITTDKDKRGVFFGYIKEEDANKDPISVVGAQMAVFWSASVHGVLGLAVNGPNTECRISPHNDQEFLIPGVTLVAKVTAKAEKEWLKNYWCS